MVDAPNISNIAFPFLYKFLTFTILSFQTVSDTTVYLISEIIKHNNRTSYEPIDFATQPQKVSYTKDCF